MRLGILSLPKHSCNGNHIMCNMFVFWRDNENDFILVNQSEMCSWCISLLVIFAIQFSLLVYCILSLLVYCSTCLLLCCYSSWASLKFHLTAKEGKLWCRREGRIECVFVFFSFEDSS